MEKIIVSFTSHPKRIWTVDKVLDSIVEQTVQPDRIILYLSKAEFQDLGDFPDFERYKKYGFEIRWHEETLMSHNKWFYSFQEYPDDIIITIDDDVLYESAALESLLKYHEVFPDAVIARRAHLITCNDDGSIAPYNDWYYECGLYVGAPRMDLLATNVGGTLYSPGVFAEEVFNKTVFMGISPYADDLWLKIMEVYSGIPVVLAGNGWEGDVVLTECQENSLFEDHNKDGGNDRQLRAILKEYPYTSQKKDLVDGMFASGHLTTGEAEAMENKEMANVLLELKVRFRGYGEILVYGAGEMGKRIFYLLEESAAEVIKAFLVDQLTGNTSKIETIAVENYRDYIGSDDKIVVALWDNDESEKVRLKLTEKEIHKDRIIMLRNIEKRALMKIYRMGEGN